MVKKREMEEMDKKKSLGIIFGSASSGIMISIFLFSYLGISVPIFYGYLIGFFFLSNKVKNKSFMGYFLVTAGFLVSCTFGIYTNEIFRILNMLIVPVSIFTGFILLTYKEIQFKFIILVNEFIKKVIGNSLFHISSLINVTKIITNEKSVKSSSSNNSKEIFKGVLISIPLVIFLIVLLAGADEMFGYYLKNISDFININNLGDSLNKIIVFTIIFLLTFGLYYSLAVEKTKSEYNNEIKKTFDEITVVTVLTFVNLIYLIFTKIQVSYLYFEKALPNGYDFAQYARSGFFQLVFLVVINLMLIVLFKMKTNSNKEGLNKVLKCAYTLITVLTFNMSITAIYKMNLYISAFGYTRLRLLVQVFTIFLCGVLILLTLFIWKEKELFKPIVVLGGIMYITLNYANIDNYIVKKNIEKMTTTNEIDVHYLSTLSADAYKAVTEGKNSGKIPSNEYYDWVNNSRNNSPNWYNYNYYNGIKNSIGICRGGIIIPNSAVYLEEIDTHGGMMGDGEFFTKIKLEKDEFDKIYEETLKTNNWSLLPINEKISITLLYGGDYKEIHYGNSEISKKIPKDIKNGLYYFKDTFAERYPEEAVTKSDNYKPMNFIITVLDKDNNLIYIYEYDS